MFLEEDKGTFLLVRPAVEKDRQQIDLLTFYGTLDHKHLDWLDPMDWLGSQNFLVLEHAGVLRGVFVIPEEPTGVYWLRLFLHSDLTTAEEAWNHFWPAFLKDRDHKTSPVGAIMLNEAIMPLLHAAGFITNQKIVLLDKILPSEMPKPSMAGLTFRPMASEDAELVSEVDRESFSAIWQNSAKTLRAGFTQQGMGTLVYFKDVLCGYQLSTLNYSYCHLARLAVSRSYQGRGIGRALLHNLMEQLDRMGIGRLSVNTQSDNMQSLALYRSCGFRLLDVQYPVTMFGSITKEH